MKKLAFFVEGYTEVLFLERLIPEICGAHKVVIDHKKIRGGGKKSGIKKTYSHVKATKTSGNEEYYFLIYDCGGDKLVGGDKSVASEIHTQHEYLSNNGYSKIIGIRDVRPNFTYPQIPKLEVDLRKYIKTKLIPVEFILSVMEIEAWFLAEYKHFKKIDPLLTLDLIRYNLKFDPANDDLKQRPIPQEDLNNCYSLVGKEYVKYDPITTNSLDFAHIYLDVKNKFTHLEKLIGCINSFIS